jgi:hypothetical protein
MIIETIKAIINHIGSVLLAALGIILFVFLFFCLAIPAIVLAILSPFAALDMYLGSIGVLAKHIMVKCGDDETTK